MKKAIAAFILGFILTASAGCTDAASSVSTLESAGFKDIHIVGYSYFGCSEDDTFHTAFVATNASGKEVHGIVCCGMIMKGCTIRF